MGVLGHEGFALSGINVHLGGLQGALLPYHIKTPSMKSRLSPGSGVEVVSIFTSRPLVL